ncbi:MAG: flagellar biosynthesis protein FlhF [Candidatus Kryptoniota bacterium]
MRIKKFTADTLNEAKEKMREELGEDAIILNSRKVEKGGVFGFGGSEYYEIVGAIDDHPVKIQSMQAKEANNIASTPSSNPEILENLRQIASKFEEKRKSRSLSNQILNADDHVNPESFKLQRELFEVKNALGEVVQQIKNSQVPILSDNLKLIYEELLEADVDKELALSIVRTTNHKLAGEELENPGIVESFVKRLIAGMVTEAPQRRPGKKGYTIALVGPTGVGKTTTIAKLASIHKLIKNENVALITADTYRVGAIDQLRAFAEIAAIQLEVVYTPDEMIAAIKKFSKHDTIFIDTVGRSQKSADKLLELSRFIDAADPNEVHLVLAANFSVRTMRDVYKKFKILKPNRLLVTKLDEGVSLGSLLSIANESRLPFSFVTNGQNVPDDIEPAAADKLAGMILNSVPLNWKVSEKENTRLGIEFHA